MLRSVLQIPRTVGTSCLYVAFMFGVLGYVLSGAWAAAAGVAGAWTVHFLFWSLRDRLTTKAWQSVADEYGLDCRRESGERPGSGDSPVERFLRGLTPPDENFELAGTVDGRRVRMFVEGPADARVSVWAVDVADLLPEWLRVYPSKVEATAGRWLDLGDIDVGHPEFDDRAVIGGTEADRLREFFWEHDLADALDELYDHVGPFEIEGGWLRHVADGTTRSERSLRLQLERLRTVANRLEATMEDTVLDVETGNEKAEAAEAAVHVYDRE